MHVEKNWKKKKTNEQNKENIKRGTKCSERVYKKNTLKYKMK